MPGYFSVSLQCETTFGLGLARRSRCGPQHSQLCALDRSGAGFKNDCV